MFSQLLVSSLAVGSLYALVALAMVIIYKTSEVPNFAQGEMAMLSTYIAYLLLISQHWPALFALAGALVFAFLLGVVLEFLFLRRAKDPSVLDLIIITLGMQLILHGLAGWKWGPEQKSFPLPISDTRVIHISGWVISELNLVMIGAAVFFMILLILFFRFTKLGIAMKATQQNPVAARINGIRTRRILSLSWGMSSLIGAVAGLLFAPTATLD
ncbi:MAG: branched-chain amino acid ABC transporter permease, partial [Calditrichaeota bacterium]